MSILGISTRVLIGLSPWWWGPLHTHLHLGSGVAVALGALVGTLLAATAGLFALSAWGAGLLGV
jgi:hypothetical protein